MSAAVIATSDDERRLGAAWCHLPEPPLVVGADGASPPKLTMAVTEDARGHGIGTALIEGLATNAATHFTYLALNVHLRNSAARLYTRSGFRVAGKGHGWFGVAMTRKLQAETAPSIQTTRTSGRVY